MTSSSKKNNISIIWDFDHTLIPMCSTTELIKFFVDDKIDTFWGKVREISGVNKGNSISTSDTPVWMYLLSEMAYDPDTKKPIPLDLKGIERLIHAHGKIRFYDKAFDLLKAIKDLSSGGIYKKNNISIHHFIITAGLRDLVLCVLKKNESESLITEIFGCQYKVIKYKNDLKNIPSYCMDKTTKTRSLFEICKGCFINSEIQVDDILLPQDEWCPFENMIYIGDGDTDIPSFSLIKSRRGMTIGVFNPENDQTKIQKKSERIRKGRRIDLFTPAQFDNTGELFRFINIKCEQIAKRYEAGLT